MTDVLILEDELTSLQALSEILTTYSDDIRVHKASSLKEAKDLLVTEPLSCGCNRLIRQGAGILLNEEDLLEELVIKGLLKKKIAIISDTKNKIKLETKENLVYSKLGLYPRGLDDLQRETGLTPQEVMGICVSLQLKGCIQERSKNYYVRAK